MASCAHCIDNPVAGREKYKDKEYGLCIGCLSYLRRYRQLPSSPRPRPEASPSSVLRFCEGGRIERTDTGPGSSDA